MELKNRTAHRLIGIDFGMVRLGIAYSDEQQIIANSMMVLIAEKRSEDTALKLLRQLEEHAHKHAYQIEGIVIGLPLLMSGKKGLLADEVTHFVDLLKQHSSIPIITWDERLTSVQADRSLREGSFTRKKRAQKVDAVAAIIILQSYLDHQKIKADRSLFENL